METKYFAAAGLGPSRPGNKIDLISTYCMIANYDNKGKPSKKVHEKVNLKT